MGAHDALLLRNGAAAPSFGASSSRAASEDGSSSGVGRVPPFLTKLSEILTTEVPEPTLPSPTVPEPTLPYPTVPEPTGSTALVVLAASPLFGAFLLPLAFAYSAVQAFSPPSSRELKQSVQAFLQY